jgi:arylsulfatase A-like enzyme
MPLEEVTLAESLRNAGYRTAFVGKWHLGQEEAFWPEAQGLEVNFGGNNRGSPASYLAPYRNPRLDDGPDGEHLTERLATETIGLLERYARDGGPFLVVHAFYAVHIPIQPPAELLEKYRAKAARLGLSDAFTEEAQYHVSADGPRRVRTTQGHAAYAALVEAMDTAAGRILDRLDELGLSDNTLVIFTSDNGGLSTAEGLPTSNLPLRAGKGWVYEGGIRVPFFARWPGTTRPGSEISAPVMSLDVMPTVLAAVGVPPPADLDGRDLTSAFRGAAPPSRPLFCHYPHYSNQGGFPGGAIRVGDWKLIENYEDGSVALYNLSGDEGERTDLAEAPSSAERVRSMRAQLHAWYRETGAAFLRAKPDGPSPWRP